MWPDVGIKSSTKVAKNIESSCNHKSYIFQNRPKSHTNILATFVGNFLALEPSQMTRKPGHTADDKK